MDVREHVAHERVGAGEGVVDGAAGDDRRLPLGNLRCPHLTHAREVTQCECDAQDYPNERNTVSDERLTIYIAGACALQPSRD
jgi:hypothetical protein